MEKDVKNIQKYPPLHCEDSYYLECSFALKKEITLSDDEWNEDDKRSIKLPHARKFEVPGESLPEKKQIDSCEVACLQERLNLPSSSL